MSSTSNACPRDGSDDANPSQKCAGLTILLVEDDADTLRMMDRLLTRKGHTVTMASSFASARDSLVESDYELLISDIGLPDGNGLDLLDLLVGKSTAGIVLSGYADDVDLARSARCSCARHLTKPIDFTQLERTIAELVPAR